MMESKKKFANKAAILAVQDLPTVEMEVPEWDCWVRVRTLTSGERDNFEAEITAVNGKNTRVNARNIRAKLVAATVVDEEGRPLFGLADVEALSAKSAKALDRIFGRAAELAGMRDADVKELAENFGATPAGG
jgi:hypothetical protein